MKGYRIYTLKMTGDESNFTLELNCPFWYQSSEEAEAYAGTYNHYGFGTVILYQVG